MLGKRLHSRFENPELIDSDVLSKVDDLHCNFSPIINSNKANPKINVQQPRNPPQKSKRKRSQKKKRKAKSSGKNKNV